MKLRKRQKEGAEVFTDSLNDIMFFLLLFFLILSTLVNPSVIKVNLPTSKHDTDIETKQIPLYVTADHKYYIYKREVNFFDLEGELIRESANVKEPSITLYFDNSLTVQDLVDVMQIGAKWS
jgi:biopolymer transport protein ExbD